MNLDNIPILEVREITKKEWKEVVDALSKQGNPINCSHLIPPQHMRLIDDQIRKQFFRDNKNETTNP